MRLIIIHFYLFISVIALGQNPFNNTYGYSGFEASAVIYNYKSDSFLMSITTEYQTNNYHSYLMELNNFGIKINGSLINNKVIEINSIKEFFDLGYIINTGFYGVNNNGVETDVLIQKTDTSGNEIWIKHYGGNQLDFSRDFEILPDSGFLIVGTTESFGEGGRDVYIVRTDKNGDSIWTKTYGNSQHGQEAYGIEKESDSVYVVAGFWGSNITYSAQVFIMKINLQGDTLAFREFGHSSVGDFPHSLCSTSDGGYVICGGQQNYMGNLSLMQVIYKVDSNFNTQWVKQYGYSGHDEAMDIKECYDHGFIMVGYSQQNNKGEDVYIVRTDSIGDTLWTRTLGGAYDDRAYSVVQTPDSGFAVVGNTYSYGAGGSDAFFLKLKPNGDITISIGIVPELTDLGIKLYPNPAKENITIDFKNTLTQEAELFIYNTLGQKVRSYSIKQQQSEISIGLIGIMPGIYYCELRTKDKIIGVGKFIKE